jgi:Transglutaminase-like superfamily
MLRLFCTFIIYFPLSVNSQENRVDFILKKNHIAIDTKDTVSSAKKIYEWITSNIKYDWESFYSNTRSQDDATAVIKKGKAICTGYATLFNDMCQRLGIRSGIIFGNARSSNNINQNMNFIQPHAWNYFIVKEKLYLIDCTWGSYDKNKNYYFDIKPEQLISTHFPSNPRYSLLTTMPTYEQFCAYPILWSSFFSNFYSDYRDISNIKLKDSVLLLPFLKRPEKDILILVNDYSDFVDFADYTYDTAKGMVFVFKNPGYYKISFFEIIKKNRRGSDGECIFEMKIATQ